MIRLRPYQEDLIQGLRSSFTAGNKKIVLCAPTGAGKTVMFSFMVQRHLEKGGRVLILTDRINLLKQANGTFDQFGIKPELITAGSKPELWSKNCHVAMIETLHRRMTQFDYQKFISRSTMIVIDEAHKTAFNKLFPHISESCLVIGATATPIRTGNQSSMQEFYTDIIQQVDTPDLIGLGNLSACHSFGVKMDLSNIKKTAGEYDPKQVGQMYQERKVYEGVISNYKRLCPNSKSLIFASSIDSAIELKEQMLDAGIPSAVIHSKQKAETNQNIIKVFQDAEPDRAITLINVGILTAGFDCPDIQSIILYRATTSLALFLQMVGRGSRTTETKDSFTLLDFGNNINEHDFWQARREWSLEKKKKKLGVEPIKECPDCGAIIPARVMECDAIIPDKGVCGHVFEKEEEEQTEEEAFLEPLLQMDKKEAMETAKTASLKEKSFLAKAKLISAYWVIHNLETLDEAKTFINYMGYKKGWLYVNKDKFKVLRNNL